MIINKQITEQSEARATDRRAPWRALAERNRQIRFSVSDIKKFPFSTERNTK
jgi:hypothetical protein